jgi:hypothetical protein
MQIYGQRWSGWVYPQKRKKKREKRFNYSNIETFSSPSQTLKLFCQTKKYERFSETINFRWNVASKKVGEIISFFFFWREKNNEGWRCQKKLLVTSNAEKFLFWLFKKFWFCYYRTVKTLQKNIWRLKILWNIKFLSNIVSELFEGHDGKNLGD